MIFKGCPRCGTGDMVERTDWYGKHQTCLQCSYTRDITGPATIKPVQKGHLKPGKNAKPQCLNCGGKLPQQRTKWCRNQCAIDFRAKNRKAVTV